MMPVPSAIDWAGFFSSTTGDGSVSVSGEIATISSGIGTGSAKLVRAMKLSPGEIVEFSVMARRVSGADSTSGGVAIDYPSTAQAKNSVRVTSSEWQEYSIRFAAPPNVGDDDRADLVVGVFTSDGGQVEFAFPRIKVDNTAFGAPRVFCNGLVSMVSGTPSLSTNFVNFGIKSLSYSSVNQELTLQLEPGVATAGQRASPIFFATMTPDSTVAASLRLVIRVGNFDRTAGTLKVRWADASTGSFVDVSTLGTFFFNIVGIL